MKKCPSCDKENQEQSLQCEHCGVSFDHSVDTPLSVVKSFSKEDAWSVFAHTGGLLPIVVFSPFVPLLIWLFHRNKSDVIVAHAKKALNFQLSILTYIIVADLLRWIVLGGDWSFLLIQFSVVFNFICSLIAIFQVSQRKAFHYPLSLKLIP